MAYNQFCPISKAMDVLGERWTLLIIRELLTGGSRFSELQKALGAISPTLLTKRLGMLEEQGLVVRRPIHGQRGHEYFPTPACKELFPAIEAIGVWGMRWMRHQMEEDDYDMGLLMTHLERSIQTDQLPGRETVIRFHFTDITDNADWWIVVEDDDIDVCIHDPGRDVDVFFNVPLRTMCELWMGEDSYKTAMAEGRLDLVGPADLTRHVERWLKPSIFAGVAPARDIMQPA